MKYKVGDTVKALQKTPGSKTYEDFLRCFPEGIGKISRRNNAYYELEYGIEKFIFYETDLVLVENKITNNNMNIKEKFILALTKEPQKSFRKAGITNGDDLLTEDGLKIFLSWLLHSKFSDEFKTAVVDDLLKEEKDK